MLFKKILISWIEYKEKLLELFLVCKTSLTQSLPWQKRGFVYEMAVIDKGSLQRQKGSNGEGNMFLVK